MSIQQHELYTAAKAGAHFLRSLPESVDHYEVLKVIGDALGDELSTEILRSVLGVSSQYSGKFQVIQASTRVEKISAIKEVRAVLGYGLREAKDFVEGTITARLNPEEATQLERCFPGFGFKLCAVDG